MHAAPFVIIVSKPRQYIGTRFKPVPRCEMGKVKGISIEIISTSSRPWHSLMPDIRKRSPLSFIIPSWLVNTVGMAAAMGRTEERARNAVHVAAINRLAENEHAILTKCDSGAAELP